MSPSKKSFSQRTSGVMKKANEVKKKFPHVSIGVFIIDGPYTLVYQSDDDLPPAMRKIVAESRAKQANLEREGKWNQLVYGPTDFITVSDALRATSGTSEQVVKETSDQVVSLSTLDRASLAVLQQLAPISHPTEHSTPPPPSKRARMATRSTTANKWNKYGFIEDKGKASQG